MPSVLAHRRARAPRCGARAPRRRAGSRSCLISSRAASRLACTPKGRRDAAGTQAQAPSRRGQLAPLPPSRSNAAPWLVPVLGHLEDENRAKMKQQAASIAPVECEFAFDRCEFALDRLGLDADRMRIRVRGECEFAFYRCELASYRLDRPDRLGQSPPSEQVIQGARKKTQRGALPVGRWPRRNPRAKKLTLLKRAMAARARARSI